MLYSRPVIEPLNLDLEALPFRESMRNFIARTIDGYPVHFRFSGGYLSAYKGEKGQDIKGLNKEDRLVIRKIARFGVTGILPEQICDLLGLTVQGKKIEGPDAEQTVKLKESMAGSGDFFDWSGRTSYWVSRHLLMLQEDCDGFVELMQNVFPDCVMFQIKSSGYGKRPKFRRIPFLLKSDQHVSFGVGATRECVESFFDQNEADPVAFKGFWPFRFGFGRQMWGKSKHGKETLEKQGAYKLGIHYGQANIQEWVIETQFDTSDDFAQECMGKLIGAIDEYFHRGLSAFDIQTGELLKENISYGYDDESGCYSGTVREWCFEKPNNYIWVGYEDPSQKHYTEDGKPLYAKSGHPVFYGIRPSSSS
ncbi:MAG: hypothetical protein KDI61_11500 [Alphaproteobacteria bacterium]|nr:hypothetical protein [Alphaproteobacteria bacterium]